MEVKYINLQRRIVKLDKLSDIEKTLLKITDDNKKTLEEAVTYVQISRILDKENDK